jgi:hypothetical protein
VLVNRWLALAISLAAVATACGDDSNGGSSGLTPDPTGRVVVDAPIDELEVIVRESFPPEYAVRIVSGLPNGCAQFNEAQITSRMGRTILISVTNAISADQNVACTAIYGQHKSVVELGKGNEFRTGTEYSVRVNLKEVRLIAQ